MPTRVITSLDEATPAWLTDVLATSGALSSGSVERIESKSSERDLSVVARLEISYSAGATGLCPRQLFLKLVKVESDYGLFGPSEVDYYAKDYVGLCSTPIPTCYSAAFSNERNCYHLLIDDHSETHFNGFNKAPTLEHGLALAEGLALLHAHWWGMDRLGQGGKSIPDADGIERFVCMSRPGLKHILEYADNQLELHWPEAMTELFRAHPQAMVERTGHGPGFTLVHGDVNPGNLLVPMEGDRPLFIIDRQPFDWSLTAWLGAYDISYAIVHWWEPEVRRQFEGPMLRRYHERLVEHGVEDYTFEDLFLDYRLCAVMSVYVATEWCKDGPNEAMADFWRTLLRRAMTAVDDLECRALWTR